MMKGLVLLLCVFFCSAMICDHALACTGFSLKSENSVFLAKNLDYGAGTAHVSINKRGLRKTSSISLPEKPFTWVAKFGSITFNLLGKEFAQGGMNEAGVAIEAMLVDKGARFSALDERAGLIMQQWIQYQLDTAATVSDIIASDSAVRVSFKYPRTVHFIACDRNGNTAIIEYVDGKMKSYTGNAVVTPVLTNSLYEKSVEFAKSQKDSGPKSFPGNPFVNSLARFNYASKLIQSPPKGSNPIDFAFSILDDVKLEGPKWGTKWSIVYDFNRREIHYKTEQNSVVRVIGLNDFDFDCSKSALYIDINAKVSQVADFKVYDPAANRRLVDESYSNVAFLRNAPESEREIRASYPANTQCVSVAKYK